jgi:putative nucleotidyltransferase with HDIG domain
VNSAFMGLKTKVSSVDQAVSLLGEKTLIKMVLQSSFELFYQDIEKGYSLTKGGLYYHAIATAKAAEQIAKFIKIVEPDIAYTAGLLHDIGKIVLDQFIAQVFPTFFDRIFNEKEDLISVEENLLGIDHTMAGKRLAELWKLPENLQQAISNHHNPENTTVDKELTHVVYFADFIISRFHTGIEIDRLNTNNFKDRLLVLGLKSKDFVNLVNSISLKDLIH